MTRKPQPRKSLRVRTGKKAGYLLPVDPNAPTSNKFLNPANNVNPLN